MGSLGGLRNIQLRRKKGSRAVQNLARAVERRADRWEANAPRLLDVEASGQPVVI